MCGYEMTGMGMGHYMKSYPYRMFPMYHNWGMYPMGMDGCMYPKMCMMCVEKCHHKKHKKCKKCKKHKKHHCKYCHEYKHHSSCKHSSSD